LVLVLALATAATICAYFTSRMSCHVSGWNTRSDMQDCLISWGHLCGNYSNVTDAFRSKI
jgi:hypothetical protein